jgi:thiamine-monophosphate kinase
VSRKPPPPSSFPPSPESPPSSAVARPDAATAASAARSEFARIDALASLFARAHPADARARGHASFGLGSGVVVGIGDDAAVLDPCGATRLVWTVDEQVDGVHFRPDWLSFRDVGFRAFMAAASDIAAMGALPWCALSSLTLPASFDDEALAALGEGLAAASREVGAPIVGGNMTAGPALAVNTTVLGRASAPVLRSGAKPGDRVLVAGALGLAAAGLAACRSGRTDAALEPALAAFRTPRARVAEGARIGGVASAAIDVSDGFAQDATHLARASGVVLVVDEEALLAAAGAELRDAASALGLDPLGLVLHGGEDYALVVTAKSPIEGFVCVGEVRAAGGPSSTSASALAQAGAPASLSGVVLRTTRGERPLAARGFDHFARGIAP